MFSRDQLKRAAALTEEDFVQLDKCRRVSATRSRQWNRSLPAGARQPNRMGQCRALRPIYPRSEARPSAPSRKKGRP